MAAPDSTSSMADIVARLRAAGIDTAKLDSDLSVVRDAANSVSGKTETAFPGDLASQQLLAAATRGYFLPNSIGFSPDKDESPDLRALLAQSELVPRSGTPMWQLKPSVRRQVLLDANASNTLKSAIDIPADSDDLEGAMLRRVIKGDLPELDAATASELDQLMVVSGWLAGTDFAAVPPTADVRRQIAKRELLEPLRVLVGRTEQDGADGSRDRIVGREKQIETLRAYVGIVPPEELRQYASRAIRSLWQRITFSDAANEPLIISGIGGMGKSSLIGKFILDHALFPGVDLPFAYLDFDRAALAPRQPLQILIDIALQFSTWFPGLEAPLAKFRADLRGAIDLLANNPSQRLLEDTTRSQLNAYCFELRSIIESINEGRAPVLLVFDTFEVVQYDQQAVKGISDLIATLRAPTPPTGARSGGSWENLRVVVAGRAGAPEITTSHPPIKLGPLPLAATVELIRRRNQSDAIGIASSQITALAKLLRGSPLDVAIVMNWLKSRDQAERASLLDEIIREVEASDRESGDAQESAGDDDSDAGADLVTSRRITGILINRMVNHINDPQVRQLAVPGLVVRAVTTDVIREVMAPASGLVEKADALSTDEAMELLRRLESERWLVTRTGECLRHRSDVRLAMLDLMRRQDRRRFDNANLRATKFFRARANSSTDMRAEAIYHLLLSGEERIEEADSYWRPEVGALLASAVDDLTGAAQVYLKVRLGRAVSAEALRTLPPRVASSLLVAFGRRLLQRGAVVGLSSVLDDLQRGAHNPALVGMVCETQYRSGNWDELREWLNRGTTSGPLAPAFAALGDGDFDAARMADEAAGGPLRFCLRLGARDPQAIPVLLQSGMADWKLVSFPTGLGDAAWDYAACIVHADDFVAGSVVLERKARILDAVGAMCRSGQKVPAAATTSGALRVLAFHETDTARPILRKLDFNAVFSTIGARMLQEFGKSFEAVASQLQPNFPEIVSGMRTLLKGSSAIPGNAVIADPKFTREFAGLVAQMAASGSEAAARCVLNTLAGTHPDWIEPAGHALTRAFPGEIPSKLGWWSSVDKYLANGGRQARSRRPLDGYAILSLADEAGSFVEALSAYAEIVDHHSDRAQDFIAIAAAFQGWRRWLTSMLSPTA